jgi:hypothetical protein
MQPIESKEALAATIRKLSRRVWLDFPVTGGSLHMLADAILDGSDLELNQLIKGHGRLVSVPLYASLRQHHLN